MPACHQNRKVVWSSNCSDNIGRIITFASLGGFIICQGIYLSGGGDLPAEAIGLVERLDPMRRESNIGCLQLLF